QPLEMSDGLVRLGGETEIRRGCGDPAGASSRSGHTPERRIQLHGVQLRGIELQEAFRRQSFGKESGLPRGIRPSRGADVQGHARKYISVERHRDTGWLLSEIPKRSEGSL